MQFVYRITSVSWIRSMSVLMQNVKFKNQHNINIYFEYANLLSVPYIMMCDCLTVPYT
jgi:hypothetical protein